jgi:hypothetical protein
MRRSAAPLWLALAVLAAHTLHVWGQSGIFWGDIGRWSHEVDRMAGGELPYRDFQWHYPPLGIWVEGALARIFGTDRTPLSLITTGIAGLLVAAFVGYARHVLNRADAAVVAVALVLALAYAQTNGAPLPLGLYSPAALVGSLCIANAARLFAKHLVSPSSRDLEWMALFAGLAVLSKQDFWIPAAFLVGVGVLRTRRLPPAVVSGAVVVVGMSIVVATAGTGILLPLAGGFGHAKLAGGQGFPSWERLTVDLFVLALVSGATLAVVSAATRRLLLWPLMAAAVVAVLTGSLHVWQSMQATLVEPGAFATPTQDFLQYHLREGNDLFRPALGWLRKRAAHTPIPVLLPPLLLLLTAWRWSRLPQARRGTIALLLGLAIAFRARRAFEGTEWFEFLLTLPVVLASIELLLAETPEALRRFRLASIAVLAALGVWAHVEQGRGFGTRRYIAEVTMTVRGPVRLGTMARDLHRFTAAMDSLDPSGSRPLFAFGFSGGWNYFTRRTNPFPFTQDFFFSAFNADSVLALPRPAGLFLIDNPVIKGGSFGLARFDLRRWEQPRGPAPYDDYDRPRFDRLREGCERVPMAGTMFALYQCP